METTQGLTTKEATKRLINEGENVLSAKKKVSPYKIFMAQFKDILILILLASTVISVLMGEITEAFTIIAIVFLNATMGFVQEFRTEKTMEKLKDMASPMAHVIRDGRVQSIPSKELVRGDVILLKSGDKVPADCRIIETNSLYCDESLLSGESVAVEKELSKGEIVNPQAGREDMAYMGTTVTKGNGKALVIATGMQTQMGTIADMLDSIEQEQTPLQKRLDQMGKYIAVGCLVICAIVSLTGVLRGEPILDMLIVGISLSVAAVPEGLPAIVTIALALSVSRMLKRNAIIRKLHAVETLGCANIICSDKTGTLTENKMTVRSIYTIDHQIEVTGNGYEKAGEFLLDGRQSNLSASRAVSFLMDIAVYCNNGQLYGEQDSGRNRLISIGKGVFEVEGEATETALLVMAAKAGKRKEDKDYIVKKELPFDSERKMMSVLVRGKGEYLFTKGAPDILLQRCTTYLTQNGIQPLTPAIRKKIQSANENLAAQALRVLGFAFRVEQGDNTSEKNLTFIGMTGMIDPPRAESYDAVLKCKRAGIRPVMITGDHKITALAIAKDLKIYTSGDEILTGSEIDALSDRAFEEILPRVSVFARVSPSHKLKIVRTLKKQGNIVAMTGDGVNDAPAIKEANIGVAMGKNGTDVTKEASSVILLDDNFATLVATVEEGRVIYQNIRKFIRYLLSCNIGEVVTMFVGMLMGMPVILLPIQILLVNLVTDGLPAIALGLDPADKNVMHQKPRAIEDSIFAGGLLSTIIFRGFLIGFTTLAVFISFYRSTGLLEVARTGALLTLVATQLFHVFECKSETRSLFSINPFNNMKLVFAVGISGFIMYLAIYMPWMQGIFNTVALGTDQLLTILCYSLAAPVLSAFFLTGKRATTKKAKPSYAYKPQ